jgi:heme exporter protein CcmD
MDLGAHAGFVWAAYAIEAAALGLLSLWLLLDGRRQRRLLSTLEARRRGAADASLPDGAPHAR